MQNVYTRQPATTTTTSSSTGDLNSNNFRHSKALQQAETLAHSSWEIFSHRNNYKTIIYIGTGWLAGWLLSEQRKRQKKRDEIVVKANECEYTSFAYKKADHNVNDEGEREKNLLVVIVSQFGV